jgi:hypothetical protein
VLGGSDEGLLGVAVIELHVGLFLDYSVVPAVVYSAGDEGGLEL